VNQNRWKNYLEFVGAAAIVASLAFVAFEIRQNTDAVRSTIIQAVSQQSFDGVALAINNEYLRDAQDAALAGNASQKQIGQLDRFYVALMRVQLNRYMQSKIGVIDRELVLEIGGRSGIYTRQSFRDYWSRSKNSYSEGFQNFVEQDLINPYSDDGDHQE
jgi:hypothetical protein